MGAAHHRDGVLVRLGQPEEPARGVEHPVHQVRRYPVAGQIEEADPVRGVAQAVPQHVGIGPQVHLGHRGDARHRAHVVAHLPTVTAGRWVAHGVGTRLPNRLVN